MTRLEQEALKKNVAEAAVEYVRDGQIVGLGTGSTIRHVMVKLAERVKQGLCITGIPTSIETERLAIEAGIPLLASDGEWAVDLALDGADQVDLQLNLIKGGGGALLKEKIVAGAAKRFVVLVDETKLVPVLGGPFPLPVEVVQFGWRVTAKHLEEFGCRVAPRMKDGAHFVTETGHYILDLSFTKIEAPDKLELDMEKVPGVVTTGLFVKRADLVLVATQQGIRTLSRP